MVKIIKIEELNKNLIPDGSTIAIGGVHSHNVPMGLVRQLIRLNVKDLKIIGSISVGLPVDILVGTNCVKSVLAPYVGFEMWGLAPKFRNAVQNNLIYAPDVCEAFPVYTLRAASNSMPFHPFPFGIHEFSDIHKQSDLYQKVTDPFTGKQVYAVKAVEPDAALIHVQYATKDGNLIHNGSVITDRLMASASKLVIVTCEKIVSKNEINPNQVSIPSFFVDYLIELPGGAFPTSSHGFYSYSSKEIKNYLNSTKNDIDYEKYIESIKIPEEEYLKNQNITKLQRKLPEISNEDYTIAELVACLFARDIKDNELGICGAVSDIPMASMQLAEKLHAPGLKWIAGGSGYVNPRGPLIPSSTDYDISIGAEARLSMDEVIPIEMKNLDFFFAGGIEIDGRGNTNLAGIPSNEGWKLRGPGSVGLAFLPRAKRVYLYTLSHNKRSLVQNVSYISGPGHPVEGNPYGNGPQLLITNLCVFSWESDKNKWKLKSIHPNVKIEDVKENTGFDFIEDDDISTSIPPTNEELKILREIDKFGYLRGNSD